MLLVIGAGSVVVNQLLLLGVVFVAPLSLQGSVSAVAGSVAGAAARLFFVAPPSDHGEEGFAVLWAGV